MERFTAPRALQLLAELGAPAALVRHHELVLEAATALCDAMARAFPFVFDRESVLVGAALHDAGKILYPAEMQVPGTRHEPAGEELLRTHGVPPELARFCVTHAGWNCDDATVEDLFVALADSLWKGKRARELERRVLDVIATQVGQDPWAVFDRVDAICEAIASDGDARLARSVV